MWVLIIIGPLGYHAGNGSVVTTQEFTSMLKCQTAQQMIKDQTINWYSGNKPITICVEK